MNGQDQSCSSFINSNTSVDYSGLIWMGEKQTNSQMIKCGQALSAETSPGTEMRSSSVLLPNLWIRPPTLIISRRMSTPTSHPSVSDLVLIVPFDNRSIYSVSRAQRHDFFSSKVLYWSLHLLEYLIYTQLRRESDLQKRDCFNRCGVGYVE